MEPVGVHARRRSQPGGAMDRPHSNRRKSDPPRFRGPPTGPLDEQRGCRPCCVQMAVEGHRHAPHREPRARLGSHAPD
eukprot:1082297-Prymnesium_polylepis.1